MRWHAVARGAQWQVRMRTQQADDGRPGEPHVSTPLSDAEIRAIAEQLVRELREPPSARPDGPLSAQQHELAPADEERVAEALVALGVVDPASTMRADRQATGDSEPRPRSWALDGQTPARADEP